MKADSSISLFYCNWRVTALPCCVGFCCTTIWTSYKDTYTSSLLSLPHMPTIPPLGLTETLDLLLDFSLLEGPHLSPLFQQNIRSWYFSSASRLNCSAGSSVNKCRDSTKWCKSGWKAIGHRLSSSLSSKTHPPSHLFNFKLPRLPTPSNSLCPLHL